MVYIYIYARTCTTINFPKLLVLVTATNWIYAYSGGNWLPLRCLVMLWQQLTTIVETWMGKCIFPTWGSMYHCYEYEDTNVIKGTLTGVFSRYVACSLTCPSSEINGELLACHDIQKKSSTIMNVCNSKLYSLNPCITRMKCSCCTKIGV